MRALGIDPGEADRSMPGDRRQIFERIRDRNFMSQYILQHDLAGVAIIDFSDFRGE